MLLITVILFAILQGAILHGINNIQLQEIPDWASKLDENESRLIELLEKVEAQEKHLLDILSKPTHYKF
jgi:hypothetical protein